MAAFDASVSVDESSPVAGASVHHEAGRVVVRLWGEHDMASAAGIPAALAEAVDHSDGDVLVDLTEVEFMDCSTLRVLVSGRLLLTQSFRRLTVRVSPSVFAHRILVLCGLQDMIEPSTGVEQSGDRGAGIALESWVPVPRAAPKRAVVDVAAPVSAEDGEIAQPFTLSARVKSGSGVGVAGVSGPCRGS